MIRQKYKMNYEYYISCYIPRKLKKVFKIKNTFQFSLYEVEFVAYKNCYFAPLK